MVVAVLALDTGRDGAVGITLDLKGGTDRGGWTGLGFILCTIGHKSDGASQLPLQYLSSEQVNQDNCFDI